MTPFSQTFCNLYLHFLKLFQLFPPVSQMFSNSNILQLSPKMFHFFKLFKFFPYFFNYLIQDVVWKTRLPVLVFQTTSRWFLPVQKGFRRGSSEFCSHYNDLCFVAFSDVLSVCLPNFSTIIEPPCHPALIVAHLLQMMIPAHLQLSLYFCWQTFDHYWSL